jgi:hypothetical protein
MGIFDNPFNNPHLVRIEGTLHAVSAALHTLLSNQATLLQRTQKIMATIDDLEADEAASHDAIGKLITLAGTLLKEIAQLSSSPVVSPAVQAKLDDLHARNISDLNDITSALTADSTPITPPSVNIAAPVITDIEPASGAPGDAVVITGTGFTGVTGVDFGGAPVANTDFHAISDTEIDTTVPPGGSGRVTVTTSAGVSNAGTFAYPGATPAPSSPASASPPSA